MKKEPTNNKLNELQAIGSFGQIGKVGGMDVTPATAKLIIAFYDGLASADLRKKFLLFDARQMKAIATGSASVAPGQGVHVELTPEAKYLVNLGKQSLGGLDILRKKFVSPFFDKLNKKNEAKEVPKL